ncbi:MAG: hypothetical protein AB9891_00225 [Anaerolineaceae bacterium]
MQQTSPITQNRSQIIIVLASVASLAVLAIVLSNRPPAAVVWATFTTVFLGIFIEAMPFLFMGTLASGLVEVYLDQDFIRRFAPRNPLLRGCEFFKIGY